MKEPALVAIIGVGGVLVGAVGSGGIQALLARGDRRREGRNAARLLYIQLHDAEKAISDVRDMRDWSRMITDWSAYETAWSHRGNALAHILNTSRFTTVASAFRCLVSLTRFRDRDMRETSRLPDGPPRFDPDDGLLGLYFENVQSAKQIVLKASFRPWEIRARKKALAYTWSSQIADAIRERDPARARTG